MIKWLAAWPTLSLAISAILDILLAFEVEIRSSLILIGSALLIVTDIVPVMVRLWEHHK